MYRFTLCGVEVRRYIKPNRSIRDAITALDVKIYDFQDRITNNRFYRSNEAAIELSEIIGEIKFMYMQNLLTARDYRKIMIQITGRDVEEGEI